MDITSEETWEITDPRVELLELALNRKYPSDKGKWGATINSSGALQLQPGEAEFVLVPVFCREMPSVLDVFHWIEEHHIFYMKEVEQMKKNLCDFCGAEVTEARPDGIHSNLWVGLGQYMITIDITKAGMVTHLCRDCRTKLVTEALSQDDPYFGLILPGDDKATEARKRKDRESYTFDSE